MSLNNLPSPKRSNQAKNTEQIKYSYKESFKIENESFLDDSAFIENYNNALKSPQSRRLYKDAENEVYPDTIMVQEILPLDKISI